MFPLTLVMTWNLPLPISPLFNVFLPLIESRFAAAKAGAGVSVADLALQIEEVPLGKGNARAEFMVIDPAGPVRITWNGIASLWAFSQGAARLARRMFEGKRNKMDRLEIDADHELEKGLDCLELARRFCSQDIPSQVASLEYWPAWAARIDPSPPAGSDDELGLKFFTWALDWILRHEIAHVQLRHAARQKNEFLSHQDCELEADLEATKWLKGGLQAAPNRAVGEKPDKAELQLERQAIANGLGLIWVALFEHDQSRISAEYPPVAERLFKCLDVFKLRQDSAAAEILSDIIQVWIAPEESFKSSELSHTAASIFDEALFRLHRHLAT